MAGVLAGCSLGGPGAQSCGGTQDCGGYTAVSGWSAYPPSSSGVAAVVKRMWLGNGNAQAKCRLFPQTDPDTIYREYGLEAGRD